MRNRASPALFLICTVRQLSLNRSSTTNSRNPPVSAGPYWTIAAGSESARLRAAGRSRAALAPDGRNIVLPLRYDGHMTVRKLSISVPAEVEETIKAAAAEEGKPVSAWLAEAATEKARAAAMHAAGRAAARELVAEYEKEHGPLPAESRQRAREFLAEAGLLDDVPQRAAG
jgi:hypothetical protein